MAGLRLNHMGLLMMIIAIVGFVQIQKSQAQTTAYTVGDALGWTVPPGGPIAYSTWASLQPNFTVGDVLVFNFTTNIHDVAKVTKSAFDSCNVTNPISLTTTGPANITLTAAGSHYFICTVGPHCRLGQKLAINVTSVSTPPPAAAPQPSAATPQPSAATPQPSAATPPPVSTPTPATSPAPTPSASSPPGSPPAPSTATPPTTSGTPTTPAPAGGVTSPPPPSSAPRSFAVAALPITILSVALAFLF